MSLVDSSYGSDDDDDVVGAEEADGVELPSATTLRSEDVGSTSGATAPSTAASASPTIEEREQSGRGIPHRMASFLLDSSARLLLPDVSQLFGPGCVSDPTSTSGSQRKRPAVNGSAHSVPRPKLPRGSLHPARVAPDTAGGLLTPPQLRGRSNVSTEDLDKIFSRRQRRWRMDE